MPVWVQPVELEEWPTQLVENAALHYSLPLCIDWNSTPQIQQTPMEIENIFAGELPGEWLRVSFMEKADPHSNLQNWADAFMRLTGFPVVWGSEAGERSPEILEWFYEGTCPPLTERLNCDETHLYQGVAKLPGKTPELAHLYVLLARRNNFAWKVSLSFFSACLPGTPEEIVSANDHARAGASFGYLHFL